MCKRLPVLGFRPSVRAGRPIPADCVNDYLCYSVKTTKGTPKFTPVNGLPLVPYAATSVLKPRDLCAAASIDNESVVNAAVHQETYQGKQLFCCVPPQAQVQDRFGTFSLALKGPDRFFVPTAVGLGSDPSGPPAPSAADTYLCYRAKLASGSFPKGLQVTATDMFETNRCYDVKKPKHLRAFDTGDGVVNLRRT